MKQRFRVHSHFKPAGDQPSAIKGLVEGINAGLAAQTLLGVTGSGKTFTIANVIAEVQRPTIILAHNKTLAAQLYGEFKEFFPDNAVEYFVSYYDYYQPEAYIPTTDTYIEKDSSINEEIDKMRHAATRAVLSRRDVIVVASVSCIYGIGSPQAYMALRIVLEPGAAPGRDHVIHGLIQMQYQRNDVDFHRGVFRVRGDIIDIFPAYEADRAVRVEFFGDEIEQLTEIDPLRGITLRKLRRAEIFPGSHYVAEKGALERAIKGIRAELGLRLDELRGVGQELYAQRLEQRTNYDIEMLEELNYCTGIENYSRHLDGRRPGEPPHTLLSYFPPEFLLVVDESHMSIPQLGAMFKGDRSRKDKLVEYGFRLPCARDNRPLTFEEYEARTHQVIYVSATPAAYELKKSEGLIIEQVVRPTGLVDPVVEVRPVADQVDDLLGEARARAERGERTLITTLTKRMAEDLSDSLMELGMKVHYLHSEIDTLERVGILRDLRLGVFDVVVGINLLREGLDLPEVSLVAILDADKQGFLRSAIALIQTIGRAARHVHGQVIMYGDQITDAMRQAIDETNRRREIQIAYNKEHHIEPASVVKSVRDLTDRLARDAGVEPEDMRKKASKLEQKELARMITELEKQMKAAAKELEFERAAMLRDQVYELREMLADESDLPPWKKVQLLAGGRDEG